MVPLGPFGDFRVTVGFKFFYSFVYDGDCASFVNGIGHRPRDQIPVFKMAAEQVFFCESLFNGNGAFIERGKLGSEFGKIS